MALRAALDARVHAARINLHLFGVVEGEDDMIRMGMVRDVTARFVSQHLAPLLEVLRSVNVDEQGNRLSPEKAILRLGVRELLRYPTRSGRAVVRLLSHPGTYRLAAWAAREGLREVFGLAARLVPAGSIARYRALPASLRSHARFGERNLRRIRWTYLRLALQFQLELTSAQIALQRLGQRIEWLVSIIALCHHAASQPESEQQIARLQCIHLCEKLRNSRAGLSYASLEHLRDALRPVASHMVRGTISAFDGLEPEPYTHEWRNVANT